jgi:hypothetical protein
MKRKRNYSLVDSERLSELTSNRKDEREVIMLEPVKVDEKWNRKHKRPFYPYMLLEMRK